MKSLVYLLFCLLLVSSSLFSQQNRQRRAIPSDEEVQRRVPNGVTFVPNLVYREGHDRWKLDLAMPSELGDEPRPAIVFIHGGGWQNGDKRASGFLNPALSYAEKGYVCITTNYRLTTMDRWRIDHCIADVKNAVRWLRANAEKYNIDPNRIGATGNSAGAHLSALMLQLRAECESSLSSGAARPTSASQPDHNVEDWGVSSIKRWIGISGPYDIVQVMVRKGRWDW